MNKYLFIGFRRPRFITLYATLIWKRVFSPHVLPLEVLGFSKREADRTCLSPRELALFVLSSYARFSL